MAEIQADVVEPPTLSEWRKAQEHPESLVPPIDLHAPNVRLKGGMVVHRGWRRVGWAYAWPLCGAGQLDRKTFQHTDEPVTCAVCLRLPLNSRK